MTNALSEDHNTSPKPRIERELTLTPLSLPTTTTKQAMDADNSLLTTEREEETPIKKNN